MALVEHRLLQHPFVQSSAPITQKVDEAVGSLFAAYQIIAAEHEHKKRD